MFHAHLNGKPSAIDDYFEGEAVEKIRKKQVRVNDEKYYYISEQLCRQTDAIKIGATFYLKTPLGMVTIKKISNNELMVKGGSWSDYGSIVDYLKKYDFYNEKTVKQIYNYLCLLKNSNCFEVVTTLCKEKPQKNETGLAYLCAILILAEPYRFRDDGKYVRGQLRKIYNDFQKKFPAHSKKLLEVKKLALNLQHFSQKRVANKQYCLC
ncbi:MAG: hypothetical protein IJI84_00025 [Clostridia bacterium]|nr:hypothetical protein [Clostridia bacterium]